MSTLKFVEKEPEEGTPTLGVVYHVTRQWEIRGLTGFEPIGWVVEEEPHEEEAHPTVLGGLSRPRSED